ncbi:MAG: hypothetical protein JWR54_914 [Mucilaginibacter sp.]|nr:hypothetical protein [Mucilaginibacter sp.]
MVHVPSFALLYSFKPGCRGNFPHMAMDESRLPQSMYVDCVSVYWQSN